MSPLDTDDWKLSAHVGWRPKRTPRRAPCDYCGGEGKIGGGFKSFDGPEDCPRWRNFFAASGVEEEDRG
jgi:hypothetical protein